MALHVEELDNFKPIRNGYAKDVEKFADLLDVAVINLEEARRYDELGVGSLYVKLQKKLPEAMLTNYHRWLHENDKFESVMTLRDWVNMEAEFHVIAAETIKGVSTSTSDEKRRGRNMHSKQKEHNDKGERKCKICDEAHGVWACNVFKALEVSRRWQLAKEKEICYCCLGDNHLSKDCRRKRKCPIDDCKSHHHKLLHGVKVKDAYTEKKSNTQEKESEKQKNTHFTNKPAELFRRTMPVILKHGQSRIVFTAMLDDASTESYVNSDLVAQLGSPLGEMQKINVNVINGATASFEATPTSLILEKL